VLELCLKAPRVAALHEGALASTEPLGDTERAGRRVERGGGQSLPGLLHHRADDTCCYGRRQALAAKELEDGLDVAADAVARALTVPRRAVSDVNVVVVISRNGTRKSVWPTSADTHTAGRVDELSEP
jgi:hypothetical protein